MLSSLGNPIEGTPLAQVLSEVASHAEPTVVAAKKMLAYAVPKFLHGILVVCKMPFHLAHAQNEMVVHTISMTLSHPVGCFAASIFVNHCLVTHKSCSSFPQLTPNTEVPIPNILRQNYKPHWLITMPFQIGMLASCQLMTWMMPTFSGGFRVPHVERLTLDDGGVVALSWGSDPNEKGVNGEDFSDIVVILPGMNNSSETGFVRKLSSMLSDDNETDNMGEPMKNQAKSAKRFLPVTVDYRGVGQSGELKNDKVCCAQNWRDFHAVFQYIFEKYPEKKIYAVGHSLGGGMLLKYLCEDGAFISGAFVLSPPVDYKKLSFDLDNGNIFVQITNLALVIPCKIVVLGHTVVERCREVYAFFTRGWGQKNQFAQNKMRRVFSYGRLSNTLYSNSLLEFEKAIVCPSYGYNDPVEYHEVNSPLQTLQNIRVKTLIVASDDDPITGNPCDVVNAKGNTENICFCSVKCGGHLGFFMTEKREVLVKSWADKVCKDFFLLLNDIDYEYHHGKSNLYTESPATPRSDSMESSTPKSSISKRKSIGQRRASVRGTLLGF